MGSSCVQRKETKLPTKGETFRGGYFGGISEAGISNRGLYPFMVT